MEKITKGAVKNGEQERDGRGGRRESEFFFFSFFLVVVVFVATVAP